MKAGGDLLNILPLHDEINKNIIINNNIEGKFTFFTTSELNVKQIYPILYTE